MIKLFLSTLLVRFLLLSSGSFNGISVHVRLPLLAILIIFQGVATAQDDVFNQQISLPRQNSSIYSVLNQISGQTGYYFVYDTEILDSDKNVRIRSDEKTMASWLEEIIDDPALGFNIFENHILVYRPEIKKDTIDNGSPEGTREDYLIVRGHILDERSRNPLPFATVAIEGKSLGITTNADGMFTLKIPGEYIEDFLSVSHLGYRSQVIPVRLFKDNKVDILLETDYISIQEVMIRYFDPLEIIREAREKIENNYSEDPVYLLNFYREGVLRRNKFINYSEALFQIYKSPYHRKLENDQVRLLQSRTISNVDQSDTLILKIRAGIRSSLDLDFISNVPDFLDPEYMNEYDFTKADIVSVKGKMAYVVDFEQKKHINEPLYKGVLYIDMESMAFLGADFEVHPEYVNKAQNKFLTRKNRNFRATIDKVAYTVSYRYFNGRYHLNHVRADLHIRYRKRYHIFSNNYHVFVEMATSRIETDNVTRFSRRESLRTDRIFMDGNHAYDPSFWSGYSIIAPEKHITSAMSEIDSRIESVVSEQNNE